MATAARRSELETVAATAGHARPRAALERAARELLAVQASDWAFMATRELAGDYPRARLEGHSVDLHAALEALKGRAGSPAEVVSPPVPDPSVRNLAPDLALAALTSP
jgi:1,4-alpha-glucan branching enzyme